jgi:8-hydroxy-5-deazaflavin:NADPH oxidoreductase
MASRKPLRRTDTVRVLCPAGPLYRKAADIVVVSIPLKNYGDVPVAPLAGKILIDTTNYYPQRDGNISELDNSSTTTAELLQAHLPTSRVVKAFNQFYATQLTTDRQPAGSKSRRALVIAGDDADGKAVVTKLLDESASTRRTLGH